jgi:GNAT superfamily N-acetyltransferase
LNWREEPIARHHDRKGFDCGSPELNEYLDRYARQNHESGGAKTFVAVSPAQTAHVLGFYSISPGAIEFARVSAKLTKKLGRYDVPVFRLGRLAIDRSVQGHGLGGDLLLAAGERALAVSVEVGGVALAIDAKDVKAARWYERFGALALLDDPLKLILPLAIIARAINTTQKRSALRLARLGGSEPDVKVPHRRRPTST